MNILSIFSGCGGLDYAAASIFPDAQIISIERDKVYAATLKENLVRHFPDVKHSMVQDDIVNVKKTDILSRNFQTVDLLIGGPPCEDFTTFGKTNGITGKTGFLIFEFLRMVREVNPSVFIFENVPNLTKVIGNQFEDFLSRFRNLGYTINFDILCAGDFGAATTRKRLFIVGTKDSNHQYLFPAPTHKLDINDNNSAHPLMKTPTLISVIEDLVDKSEKDIANHQSANHRQETIKKYDDMTPGTNGGRSFVWRAKAELPCRSLIAGSDTNCKAYIHPLLPREMTVREYGRIQGFPDSWVFSGTRQKGLKQVANSVPIPLGKAILSNTKNILRN